MGDFFDNSWPRITYLNIFSFIFLFNKVIFPRRFMIYFVFLLSLFYQRLVIVILTTFGLSSFYRHGAIRHLVVTFYLYRNDSDKQYIFDRSEISNYSRQYIEELKFYIF